MFVHYLFILSTNSVYSGPGPCVPGKGETGEADSSLSLGEQGQGPPAVCGSGAGTPRGEACRPAWPFMLVTGRANPEERSQGTCLAFLHLLTDFITTIAVRWFRVCCYERCTFQELGLPWWSGGRVRALSAGGMCSVLGQDTKILHAA